MSEAPHEVRLCIEPSSIPGCIDYRLRCRHHGTQQPVFSDEPPLALAVQLVRLRTAWRDAWRDCGCDDRRAQAALQVLIDGQFALAQRAVPA